MTAHTYILKGCAPTPLANYLKALGILRLIGEQADSQARGWWDGELFLLLTKLDQTQLEDFFLHRYEPTPLLSPWNKGSGFFKNNDPGLTPLEKSGAPRLQKFRRGLREARQLIDAIAHADSIERSIAARTKLDRSFQTESQRELLKNSSLYKNLLATLNSELAECSLTELKRKELADDLSVAKSLVNSEKPTTRAEVEALKRHKVYKQILADAKREFKAAKAALVPKCWLSWRSDHAAWLATAVILDEQGSVDWPALLGTGGNDGNLDFTNSYMVLLGSLFELSSEDAKPKLSAHSLLRNSLWDQPTTKLSSASIGQYQPGAAGGANSSTGFSSGNLVNSWDYVFMLEGTLVFQSQATKRLDSHEASRGSAPFAVRSHAAGFASAGEEKAQRGEQWMPLWKQPTTLTEIRTLYSEARLQYGRHISEQPVDAALAISRLGVCRGIDAFVRYGFLERNGQSTLAVPLGRFKVQHRPRGHLLDDLTQWMSRLKRMSRDKNAQPCLVQAERRLSEAIFAALTHDDHPQYWQAVLRAAVAVEALQATGTAIKAGPIPELRSEWVQAIDDGSPEFRLALALGSAHVYDQDRSRDTVRHHWLPLKPGGRRFLAEDNRLIRDPRVVIFGRDTLRDLSALVQRRLIESSQKGQRRSRLLCAPGCGADLADLAQFVDNLLDVDKIFDLARALMALRWGRWSRYYRRRAPSVYKHPDEGWLAIRLCCLPWALYDDRDIPADPRIIRLLSSGRSSQAIDIAISRLRTVSVCPPLTAGWADAKSSLLWAAALAFPISKRSARQAANIIDPR